MAPRVVESVDYVHNGLSSDFKKEIMDYIGILWIPGLAITPLEDFAALSAHEKRVKIIFQSTDFD